MATKNRVIWIGRMFSGARGDLPVAETAPVTDCTAGFSADDWSSLALRILGVPPHSHYATGTIAECDRNDARLREMRSSTQRSAPAAVAEGDRPLDRVGPKTER